MWLLIVGTTVCLILLSQSGDQSTSNFENDGDHNCRKIETGLLCQNTLPPASATDLAGNSSLLFMVGCCGVSTRLPAQGLLPVKSFKIFLIDCQFTVGGNRTLSVDPGTWSTFVQLQGLSLSNCNFRSIPDGDDLWRRHSSNLLVLELEANRIEALTDVGLGVGCRVRCGVEQTPDGFYPLNKLSLNSNLIRRIDEHELCNVPGLVWLYLRDNRIDVIARGAFAGLHQLANLDLSGNAITYLDFLDPCPPPDSSLLQVIYIDVTGNRVGVLGDSLKRLTRLRWFSANNNVIASIPDRLFEAAENVTVLDLSNNRIEYVGEDSLAGLTRLEFLVLENNSIAEMHPGALVPCAASLTSLLLSGNLLTRLPNVTAMRLLTSLDVSNNSIGRVDREFDEVYLLKWLDLSHNNLSEISFALLPPQLRNLQLDHNRIGAINNFRRGLLPLEVHLRMRLVTLDLSHNRLRRIKFGELPNDVHRLLLNDNLIDHVEPLTFFNSNNLQLLSMANNSISRPCASWFDKRKTAQLQYRPRLELAGNPLQCTCETLWLMNWMTDSPEVAPYVTDLHQAYCTQYDGTRVMLWSGEPRSTLFACDSTVPCACQESLIFGNDVCPFPFCPENCTCLYASRFYTIVNCTLAGWTHVPPPPPDGLAILWMVGNDIEQLDVTSFPLGYRNSTFINLAGNGIRRIEVGGIFARLKMLKKLRLSLNLLEEMHNDTFAGLAALEVLELSANRLRHLATGTFQHLPHLNELLLDDNRLANFPAWTLRAIVPTLRDLALDGNPWNCTSCEFVRNFREIFVTPDLIVHRANKIACSPTSTDVTLDATTSLLLLNNSRRCYPGTVVMVGSPAVISVSVVISVVVLVASILLVVYRFEVKVLIHHHYGVRLFDGDATTRRRRGDSVDASGDDVRPFDIFVSYSEHDESFLVDHLLSRLQDDPPSAVASGRGYGFRLCLHHRDFLVGGYINQSIIDAVSLSRRTLVLLTESYVASSWCMFEFKMAHAEMLNRGSAHHAVVVVLPDGRVPLGAVDHNELRLFLEETTYLRWGDRLFWPKLCYALPDRRQAVVATADSNVCSETRS